MSPTQCQSTGTEPPDFETLGYPAQFDALLERGGIGLMIVSPDLQILDANRCWRTMTGYSREALLTLGIEDLTHPDDLQRSLDFVRGGRDTQPRQIEKRYRRADGSYFWARVRTQAVREGGRLRHAL